MGTVTFYGYPPSGHGLSTFHLSSLVDNLDPQHGLSYGKTILKDTLYGLIGMNQIQ